MTLYKIQKECYLLRSCLIDAGRMLFFMVEQVFVLMGGVWSMHNADTQCTEREPEGREEFLCLNFSFFAINMNSVSHSQFQNNVEGKERKL